MSMKTTVVLDSPEGIAVTKERVICYFEDAGYKMNGQDVSLLFQRGSFMGSLTSFSPKRWKALVKVDIVSTRDGGTSVTLDYDINTTGQVITRGEVEF